MHFVDGFAARIYDSAKHLHIESSQVFRAISMLVKLNVNVQTTEIGLRQVTQINQYHLLVGERE